MPATGFLVTREPSLFTTGGAPLNSGYCITMLSAMSSKFKLYLAPTSMSRWSACVSRALSNRRFPRASVAYMAVMLTPSASRDRSTRRYRLANVLRRSLG